MKWKHIIIMTVLSVMFFTTISCKANKENSDDKAEENAETVFAVNTTFTVKGEIKDYIELNGDVKSKNEVNIYSDTVGKLVSFTVSIGSSVRKDQVIAYVDPSRPGMDYKASPVKSTISGTVTELPAKIGETISQQSPVAKVGKIDQLEIVTYIAEKYISKMKKGLDAIIKTQAYPEKTFKGTVSIISPVIDPVSRMLEVRLNILNNQQELKPGMFAEVKIITEQKENIVKIPAEAIVKRYGQNYVFVIKDKKKEEDSTKATVEKREITSGIKIDNKVEIVKGLNPDEEIVYRGQTLLEDGSPVKIIDTFNLLTAEDNIE
jgi:membrane fusion protein, multidrug efflux system